MKEKKEFTNNFWKTIKEYYTPIGLGLIIPTAFKIFKFENYFNLICSRKMVEKVAMVLLVNDNLEIGLSEPVIWSVSRHLFRSTNLANLKFKQKNWFSSHVRNVLWFTICYKYHGSCMHDKHDYINQGRARTSF